jgi:hypothetical protein
MFCKALTIVLNSDAHVASYLLHLFYYGWYMHACDPIDVVYVLVDIAYVRQSLNLTIQIPLFTQSYSLQCSMYYVQLTASSFLSVTNDDAGTTMIVMRPCSLGLRRRTSYVFISVTQILLLLNQIKEPTVTRVSMNVYFTVATVCNASTQRVDPFHLIMLSISYPCIAILTWIICNHELFRLPRHCTTYARPQFSYLR